MPNQVTIKDPRRAGQAPYNFVPLPPKARWLEEGAEPPAQDRYHENRFSGSIRLGIEALTDFYIRGLMGWNAYVENPKTEKGDKPSQPEPYLIEGKLAIPGASLRGMTRTLMEILGESPLDPVNDSQLYFRTVGSTSNPGDRNSFEPHAVAYKSRIDTLRLPDNVKAGYLYGNRDDDQWYIVPAQKKDRQFYQVPMAPKGFRGVMRPDNLWQKPKAVWFRPGRIPKYADMGGAGQAGYEEGVLLCSGGISKKRHQWVIRKADPKAAKVVIPEADVLAYRESGISQAIKEKKFEYTTSSQGVPCFYVEWTSPSKTKHVTFGHTYNMRIPYERSVAEAVPASCRRPDKERWDLAQAVFGRMNDGTVAGARGRVFFEDAILAPDSKGDYERQDRYLVLGQPKPTTFQHYLVQTREDVVGSIHWDGNYRGEGQPVVRGHKLYFHRPGAPIQEPGDKQKKNVATKLRPAKKGCRFEAVVRFENLSARELGALIAALELPEGCAHKIGMAKPLGFGSMRFTVTGVDVIDRTKRYSRLFASLDDGAAGIETGAATASADDRAKWTSDFATWVAGKTATLGDLWKTPRMAELKALLTIDGLPADWNSRTRYLEFGQTDKGQYNEYKHIGYPKLNERGYPFLEQRRPLPAATQVLTDRRMPNSPRPNFAPPRDGDT